MLDWMFTILVSWKLPQILFYTMLACRADHIYLQLLVLFCILPVLQAITCYECTSSQGEDCKTNAVSCQLGLFGCLKMVSYSGGVDRMGNWAQNQDRSIISMVRGCALLPLDNRDVCRQYQIIPGTRFVMCTCFNDYCNSGRSSIVSIYIIIIILLLI